MNPSQQAILKKAVRSWRAAQTLYDEGFSDFAASRAYYSMFYVAEAFLEEDQMSFSSHAAVISAFGRDFAKPKRVPPHFHRYLLNAQDKRNRGDYGFYDEITPTQAKELIDQAEEFLQLAQSLIGNLSDET
ncbi:UNVERIFIED_CONTAM: DNA-binding protein [Euhalothece sp. KZN 001]